MKQEGKSFFDSPQNIYPFNTCDEPAKAQLKSKKVWNDFIHPQLIMK